MAIRTWRPHTLGLLWIAGLVLEAILVSVAAALGPERTPREQRLESLVEGVASATREGTPPALARRDTLLRVLRDSFGATLSERVATVRPYVLPKATEDELERLGKSRISAYFLGAALCMPIPIALLAITGVWLHGRRLAQRGPPAPGRDTPPGTQRRHPAY